MAGNAFRFFRGTCHLFYEDLVKTDNLPQAPLSWICGDLHLENFGSYKGDNRLVYFDLNDYDEAMLAPVCWELVRMVTSIFTGFESLKINKSEAYRISKLFLETYAETLKKGKALYIEPQTAGGIVKSFLEKICDRKQKALLQRYALLKTKAGKPGKLINNSRLYPVPAKEKRELMRHLGKWIKLNKALKYPFKITDVSFRIAGTGSVGVKRYAFLVQNTDNPKKFNLIDMKEAKPSSLAPYLQIQQPVWASEAERVVSIQHRMQNVSPALLGVTNFKGEPFVFKELQPTADKIDFLVIKDKYKDILQVIEDMAILTASAQLRSSGRQGSDSADLLIGFGKNQDWQNSLIEYANIYSRQVKKDYQSFLREYNKGYFSQNTR
jgi:uncharacterized protein (DUF2252 family)